MLTESAAASFCGTVTVELGGDAVTELPQMRCGGEWVEWGHSGRLRHRLRPVQFPHRKMQSLRTAAGIECDRIVTEQRFESVRRKNSHWPGGTPPGGGISANTKQVMRRTFKTSFLALAAAAVAASTARGAVSLESGSIALAFYQLTPGPGGGSFGPNTYIFDLGQASLYRENTAYGVSVSTINSGIASSNIGADLSAAFGPNWANGGTVRWTVLGNIGDTDPTVGGDPARTSYISRGTDSISETIPPAVSSANGTGLNSDIKSLFAGVQNSPSADNADGTIIPISALRTVDEHVNPTTLGLYFTLGTDPTQSFQPGTFTDRDGSQLEGALDVYRLIHTTDGADLTAGYSAGDAVVRNGQYIGTFTIDSLGNLAVIPEPSAALLGILGAVGVCLLRRRNA